MERQNERREREMDQRFFERLMEQMQLAAEASRECMGFIREMRAGGAANQQAAAPANQADQNARQDAMQARREYLEFLRNHPKFERGKDRWSDFAFRFESARERHGVGDEHAKAVLYNEAIVGQSSRLVIASMRPNDPNYAQLTFAQYLQRMGEKFTPAAESIQMEAEYKARVQGRQEDIQNYITAKHELFLIAYPNAQDRDRNEFYRKTTEGVLNKYVRDNLFTYEPANLEGYANRAVQLVQIQRRRIQIGDSDSASMDGLIPVTRPLRDNVGAYADRGEPMEVDNLWWWSQQESTGEEEPEDGTEDYCECMALQERGQRGPCYYCLQRGHFARGCPRRAAGLPRALNPAEGARPSGYRGRPPHRGGPRPARGFTPNARGMQNRGRFRGRGRGGPNRGVHQLDAEEEDSREEEQEGYVAEEEDGAPEDLHFLEDATL